jgi:hypothetical protein
LCQARFSNIKTVSAFGFIAVFEKFRRNGTKSPFAADRGFYC